MVSILMILPMVILMIIPIVITMVSAGGCPNDYSDECSDGFCWALL